MTTNITVSPNQYLEGPQLGQQTVLINPAAVSQLAGKLALQAELRNAAEHPVYESLLQMPLWKALSIAGVSEEILNDYVPSLGAVACPFWPPQETLLPPYGFGTPNHDRSKYSIM